MTISAVIDRYEPDPFIIAKAGKIIRAGGLVAFPTETVYGLGADALNPDAVRKIYAAKGRPSNNPLILHVAAPSQAGKLVEMNEAAVKLAVKFWPGPLTFVLPAKNIIPSETRGGLDTAAVRVPDNVIALALINETGGPIAAPSANLSGRPSPTDAETVFRDMNGKIDMIIDGGSVNVGIESTVIDLTDPEHPLMLRPGGLAREKIEAVLGLSLEIPDDVKRKRSPGTHYRHYAPSIPVKIWHKGILIPQNSAYMGINIPDNLDDKPSILFTSVASYAHGLFAGFRKFEADKKVEAVYVEWPEDDSGLSEGLRDRISRAAGMI